MQRRLLAYVLVDAALLVSLAPNTLPGAQERCLAKGRVFHDANGNRTYDLGEKLLGGIRVSNGVDIVHTDAEGHYELTVTGDTILFVVKPRGWQAPLNSEHLPQFYYIHKPAGSPELKFPGVEPTGPLPASVDFALYPQDEPDRFQAILLGDTQPRDQKEIDYLAHDVIEELIGTDASFGVTLGDILFDDLSLFASYTRTVALVGIPWYNVLGNHDINRDAEDDPHSDETFERFFGPSYYSFDYGPAHFLVLDDVEWVVEADEKGEMKKTYRGGLGDEQMAFIRNDLEGIPEDQLVVLMMHIPLVDVRDRHELYRLIEKRPFSLSVSAHEHYHQHVFISSEDGWNGSKPHHHVINVTACGSWWSGTPDETGIPHTMMRDGAPNGYSIITFDGQDYSLEFKAARRPADYQMNIHAPEVVTASEAGETNVFVNVFAGSERSTVEMRLGPSGAWVPMQRIEEKDPFYVAVYEAEEKIPERKWQKLPEPTVSSHLWKAPLPTGPEPGTHLLYVRTTDMFGHTYTDLRTIRIEGARN